VPSLDSKVKPEMGEIFAGEADSRKKIQLFRRKLSGRTSSGLA
jgi:hypothetical protein